MNRPRFSPPPPVSSPSRALPAGARGWPVTRSRVCCARGRPRSWPGSVVISSTTARRPPSTKYADYPEVKALVKKMEKDGSYAAQCGRKGAGRAELRRPRWPRCGRSIGWPTWACGARPRRRPTPSSAAWTSCSTRKRPMAASLISRSRTRPRRRRRWWRSHFQGWAVSALCRVGFEGDSRVEKGFQFLLERRQDDGGWAWRGVRTDSAARPSSHLITGMVLRAYASSTGAAQLARGAARGRAAGDPLPAARIATRPQSAELTGRC